MQRWLLIILLSIASAMSSHGASWSGQALPRIATAQHTHADQTPAKSCCDTTADDPTTTDDSGCCCSPGKCPCSPEPTKQSCPDGPSCPCQPARTERAPTSTQALIARLDRASPRARAEKNRWWLAWARALRVQSDEPALATSLAINHGRGHRQPDRPALCIWTT